MIGKFKSAVEIVKKLNRTQAAIAKVREEESEK